MGTRIKYDVLSEYVKPKLEDLDIQTIDYSDVVGLEKIVQDVSTPSDDTGDSPAKKEGDGYSWRAWGLNIDLSDIKELADALKKFLEVVDKISKILVTAIKLLQIFTSDFKSIARLLKVLLKVIVKKLQDIIEGFTSAGVYVSIIFPNCNTRDRNFVLPINGGYREFVTNVNARCLNSKDEDAPKFGPGDAVGGFIIGMIGGSNDPNFLYDLMTNFRVLGRLFRFIPPTPSPAKNVTAVPGFYKSDERDEDGKRILKLGVKISWDHPGTPVSGFMVRRSRHRDGIVLAATNANGVKENIRVYRDEEFDVDAPLINVVVGRPHYHYIDFNVNKDQLYFYKVYSTVGYDFLDKYVFFQRIESPVASKTVYAIPRNKIPLSELVKETVFDRNGNRVHSGEFDGDWQSFTLRTLLGPEIDQLLSQMDRMTEKLLGLVSTSGDAMSDYIKFFQKKIKFYMDIVNKIVNIITRLAQLRLSGTLLLLSIDPEKGGMQNFVNKFNSAVLTEDVKGLQVGTKKNDNSIPFPSLMDEGIMAGVILLYGYPQLDGDYVGNLVPKNEINQLEKSLDKSKKALEAFLALLGLGG
jgi:hypothetical protein